MSCHIKLQLFTSMHWCSKEAKQNVGLHYPFHYRPHTARHNNALPTHPTCSPAPPSFMRVLFIFSSAHSCRGLYYFLHAQMDFGHEKFLSEIQFIRCYFSCREAVRQCGKIGPPCSASGQTLPLMSTQLSLKCLCCCRSDTSDYSYIYVYMCMI